jgi:hypothetical protein
VLAGSAAPPVVASSAPPLWSWGSGEFGELGDGTFTQHSSPVHTADVVSGAEITRLRGPLHRDRVRLGRNGNDTGVLGLGATGDVATPTQVPGLAGITHLAATGDHVLALANSGTTYAWGANGYGELGVGTCCRVSNPVPAQVTSLASVSQVAVGDEWMLAVGTQAPPPPLAVVPNLGGDTSPQASQSLQAVGLVLGTVGSVVDNHCKNLGTVLAQNPAAGTHVNLGSAVSITIGAPPKHACP